MSETSLVTPAAPPPPLPPPVRKEVTGGPPRGLRPALCPPPPPPFPCCCCCCCCLALPAPVRPTSGRPDRRAADEMEMEADEAEAAAEAAASDDEPRESTDGERRCLCGCGWGMAGWLELAAGAVVGRELAYRIRSDQIQSRLFFAHKASKQARRQICCLGRQSNKSNRENAVGRRRRGWCKAGNLSMCLIYFAASRPSSQHTHAPAELLVEM